MIGLAVFYLLSLVAYIGSVPIKINEELHFQSTVGENRLAVIANRLPPVDFWLVFDTNEGSLRYKQNIKKSWTAWHELGHPEGTKILSNPVALYNNNNQINVFCLATNGQVYQLKQHPTKVIDFGEWLFVGSELPIHPGVSLQGQDNVKALNYQGKLTVFVRSLTTVSGLFWTQEINGKWAHWQLIGGTRVGLLTDVAVAYNGFSKYMEAFAVMTDKKLYRTWQTGPNLWVSWDKTGYYAPTTVHAPVVHSMSHDFFNGVLNVFVNGEDGSVHHIYQTTCDKLPNPWGWCTWSLWNSIGGAIPESNQSANPLSVGANIHKGIEVFTADKNGGLWHMWQLYRGGHWNPWEYVGRPDSGPMSSHPAIVNDEKGWWAAFALGVKDEVEIIEQKRSLTVNTSLLSSGQALKVSWSVPVDEATNQDWIGVYPSGAANKMYVDFLYVGGSQNPLKDPVPKGALVFTSYLPNGKYDYRYLANLQFFDAVGTSLTVTNGSSDAEWVQLYKGIASGLGVQMDNFRQCVKDGNKTVATFKKAFGAFENGKIYEGMHLIGDALMDVAHTFINCEQTPIAEALEKLAYDFLKCTEGRCVSFSIDVLKELVILFEDVYEIYGNIRAASNSFKIKAYQQGGLCIGRVVNVCISMPS